MPSYLLKTVSPLWMLIHNSRLNSSGKLCYVRFLVLCQFQDLPEMGQMSSLKIHSELLLQQSEQTTMESVTRPDGGDVSVDVSGRSDPRCGRVCRLRPAWEREQLLRYSGVQLQPPSGWEHCRRREWRLYRSRHHLLQIQSQLTGEEEWSGHLKISDYKVNWWLSGSFVWPIK